MDLSERPTGPFQRHPWETSRSRFFSSLVGRFAPPDKPIRILDVGAGDGWFAHQLLPKIPPGTRILCWDPHYSEDVLSALATGSHDSVRFSATKPAERFTFLLLLDVLEHIDDDRTFLESLVQENLEKGGRVIVSVPAWQWLFGQHDERLKHYRRYSPRACRFLIQECGLKIMRSGGLFHCFLPIRFVTELGHRISKTSGANGPEPLQWRYGFASSRLVESLLFIDNAISSVASGLRLQIPGTSWWAVCERSL